MREDKRNEGLDFIPIPDFSFMENPPMYLTDTLKDIIINEMSASSETYTDDDINQIIVHVPQLLAEFRKFYFSLYKKCGYAENQVTTKLLKRFRSYSAEDRSSVRHFSSKRMVYRSPYE